jgi:APA family basic amino acid/polyamine antiporter
VIAVVAVADLRGAIGFSSFAVLGYYAIANASSYTLPRSERRWPRAYSVLGIVGCVVLAVSLPWESIAGGAILLAAGALVWLATRALRRRSQD